MSGRTWLLTLSCSVAVASCDWSGSGVTDCPWYVRVQERAPDGFLYVGQWRTDAVCAQYCQEDYPVCQLVTETSVKCQKGCD